VSSPRASAQVLGEGAWCQCRVRDLSLHGVGLDAEHVLPSGAAVWIQLALHGASVHVDGHVVWSRPGRAPSVGIEFDANAPTERRVLAASLVQAACRQDAPAGAVLVHVADAETRAAIVRAVRRRGREVVLSATPLEAVWRANRAAPPLVAAVVSHDVDLPGAALLATLAREHPEIRRVLVSRSSAPCAVDPWVLDRVLLEPWDRDDLEAVLDLIDEPMTTAPTGEQT